MAAPDRANDRGRIVFDDIRGAKTGLFGDPVKEVLRVNPATADSARQQAYANARQTPAAPLRGQEVTVKGVNDGWRTPKAIAQGVDNTGGSQRYNPATANSPTQTAYRESRWAPGADTPLRGEVRDIKGVTNTSGWDDKKAVVRGFGAEPAAKPPVKIDTNPGRGGAFRGGMLGTPGGGAMGWENK
jgi:hypothetical protein